LLADRLPFRPMSAQRTGEETRHMHIGVAGQSLLA